MTCTIISNRAELQLECKNENEMPYCGVAVISICKVDNINVNFQPGYHGTSREMRGCGYTFRKLLRDFKGLREP